MQKERLLKLADLLDADAKNKKGIRFDLNYYVRPVEYGDEPTLDCHTMACAVGIAYLSGAFKKQGLGIRRVGEELIPTYRDLDANEAAEVFFGIPHSAFNFLFMPESYPPAHRKGAAGERRVAKRIRAFVAGVEVAPEDIW